MDIDTHDDGAWPDLTGDGRADFDDFVLFAAISDKAKEIGRAHV